MMSRTTDRASDVLTTQQIGRTQELTPEGFLLCRDVPIARAGEMIYVGGEVPVAPARDGLIRVTRDEMTLLDPSALASFEGKAITIDHPGTDVSPQNWKRLAVGLTRNVRAGTDDQAGMMVADLLVMDAAAISDIRGGLREVSCGYDAEYEDLGGGRGRQSGIIGNHVALVRRGRCGPVCAIGDSQMATRTHDKTRLSLKDRIKAAFYTRDEDSLNDAMNNMDEAPDNAAIDGDDKQNNHTITINLAGAGEAAGGGAAPVTDDVDGAMPGGEGGAPQLDPAVAAALAPLAQAIQALNARMDAIAPPAAAEGDEVPDEDDADGDDVPDELDEDDEDPTRDSSALAEEFTDTLARAEILSPGIKIPTFDKKVTRKSTIDAMCALRRRALDNLSDANRVLIDPVLRGRKVDKLTCDALTTVFVAASELVKNRRPATFNRMRVSDNKAPERVTAAMINEKARDHWAKSRKN